MGYYLLYGIGIISLTTQTFVSTATTIKLTIPEECKRLGYCLDVPNYPVELVESVVAKLGEDVKKFQMDTLDDVIIPERLGAAEETLCPSEEKIINPVAAMDKDGVWYTVLNLKNRALQSYRAEVCSSTGNECSIATFPPNYSGTCEQKYIYRLAEVLDDKGNHIQAPVKLPSCCSCELSRV